MFTTSNLELDPPIGTPGQIVTVRWRLGTDLSYFEPTIDDEIRMTTSSGELLSRVSLDFYSHQDQREFKGLAHWNDYENEEVDDDDEEDDEDSESDQGDNINNINGLKTPSKQQKLKSSAVLRSPNSLMNNNSKFLAAGSPASSLVHLRQQQQQKFTSFSQLMPFNNTSSSSLTTTNNTTNRKRGSNIGESNIALNSFYLLPGTSDERNVNASSRSQNLYENNNNNNNEGSFGLKNSLLVGERSLRCPPFSGGFIVSLYRCSTEFQRILSVPFRVEKTDQSFEAAQVIQLIHSEEHQNQVLTSMLQIMSSNNNINNNNNLNSNSSFGSQQQQQQKLVRKPLQTVSVKFRWSDVVQSNTNGMILGVPLTEAKLCSVLAICQAQSPDNSGFSTEGTYLDNNNFSHCCRVIRLFQEGDSFTKTKNNNNSAEPATPLALRARNRNTNSSSNSSGGSIAYDHDEIERHFVGPDTPGEYVCRLMVRAATNIFHTAAFSASFTVIAAGDTTVASGSNTNLKSLVGNNNPQKSTNSSITSPTSNNNNNNSSTSLALMLAPQQKLLGTLSSMKKAPDPIITTTSFGTSSSAPLDTMVTNMKEYLRGKQSTKEDDDNQLCYTESYAAQLDYLSEQNIVLLPDSSNNNNALVSNNNNNNNSNNNKLVTTTSELGQRYKAHGTFQDLDEILRDPVNNKPVSGISPVAHAARQQRQQRFGAPERRNSNNNNNNTNKNNKNSNSSFGDAFTSEMASGVSSFAGPYNNNLLHHHHQQLSLADVNASSSSSFVALARSYGFDPQTLMNSFANFALFQHHQQQQQSNNNANNNNNNNPSSFFVPGNTSFGGTRYANTAALQEAVIKAAMAEPYLFSAEATLRLEASKYRVFAGQFIRIKFDVRAASYGNKLPPPADVVRRHLPTSLDHLRFIPYGRSECDKYDGAVTLCIPGGDVHSGIICVKTPNVSGCFDLGLRRFTDNETLVLAKFPIVTDWPDGEIVVFDDVSEIAGTKAEFSLSSSPSASFRNNNNTNIKNKNDISSSSNNKNNFLGGKQLHEATVYVTLKPGFMCSQKNRDRLIVFDETATLVAFSLIEWDTERNDDDENSVMTTMRSGKAIVRIPISGRFNVRLFSSRVGHVLPCKAKELMTVPAVKTYPLPFASLLALKKVPARAADIGISFVKLIDVEDLRPIEIQMRDAVVIVPFGSESMKFSTTTHFDDPKANPYLRCEVLYNASSKFIVFDIRNFKPARYLIKFMVGTANPFVRVCTSECSFDVCERGTEFSEHLATTGGELEVPRDCDMFTSQQFVERLTASEQAPVRHLRRNAAEIATVTRRQQQQKEKNEKLLQKSMISVGLQQENEGDEDDNNDFGGGFGDSSLPVPKKAGAVVVESSANLQQQQQIARYKSRDERANMSFVEKRRALLRGSASLMPTGTNLPVMIPPPHDIDGHLFAPVTVTVGELFSINVFIARGTPCQNDLIVLCSEDLAKVFSQVSVGRCLKFSSEVDPSNPLTKSKFNPLDEEDDQMMLQEYLNLPHFAALFPDMAKRMAFERKKQQETGRTMVSKEGEAKLYAPPLPSKCVAVYFSQALNGGLFKSNVIKVKKNTSSLVKKDEELSSMMMSENNSSISNNNNNDSQQKKVDMLDRSLASVNNKKTNIILTSASEKRTTIDENTEDYSSDLRKVFETLIKRRLAPDGSQQYETGQDAPLFGLVKQPSRLISATSFLNNNNNHQRRQKSNDSPISPKTPTSTKTTIFGNTENNNATTASRQPRLRILLVGVSYLKQRYDLDGPSNDVAALFSFFKQHFSSSNQNNNSNPEANRHRRSHDDAANDGNNNKRRRSDDRSKTASATTVFDHIFDPEKDARVLHQNCEDPLLQPTATNIRRGFAWLIEDAQPNDHLIFYFSGSGALVPQLWNWNQKWRSKDGEQSVTGNNNMKSSSRKKQKRRQMQQRQLSEASQQFSSSDFSSPTFFSSPPPLSTEVSQVLLPSDFDFGRRSISYREILREIYEKVSHLETITVTTIIDAGFAVDAPNIIEQRRGAQLADSAIELGQTLLTEERKKVFNVRTKCRCVPPPQPYPLVAIGEDQESIDSPPVIMTMTSDDCDESSFSSFERQQPHAKPYRLGGLSPFFVSSCSPCATSYSTEEVRKYLPKATGLVEVEETIVINIPRNSFFFEASRGGAHGNFAWDTFSQWGGGSMGLFTNSFVSILSKLARERRNGLVGVNWFDLLERVQRDVRRSRGGQWQHPLLWTSARAFKEQETSPFLESVFPLAHDKELDE